MRFFNVNIVRNFVFAYFWFAPVLYLFIYKYILIHTTQHCTRTVYCTVDTPTIITIIYGGLCYACDLYTLYFFVCRAQWWIVNEHEFFCFFFFLYSLFISKPASILLCTLNSSKFHFSANHKLQSRNRVKHSLKLLCTHVRKHMNTWSKTWKFGKSEEWCVLGWFGCYLQGIASIWSLRNSHWPFLS